mmetsp:Transcript_41660/g.89445  ORF Transcript_41660/g.89445 Transcript_41660/m.89445 type:complete len:480 (-) Transcript_41660:84-1523(-)|eukprot:CAMPEP_0206533362 /NCGR_PEP_ID=MMETSP0325_2-20121206/4911_1 /ASSEMBLY_ACC=CAM_ASM_000347 /TAXON_ID=2866 /ORGANISM="Crypthecodinium cohnii, Strain Seligo" /LENGTH=479 /DNA_ID=CAMNT_0054029973 /DNA_START=16 /DNA_END=1455 /DNA_ORIENTATION=+
MAVNTNPRWIRDVQVQNAALMTTGGKVWRAAHELGRFLEARHDELAWGHGGRILEIGAGCGWLGLYIARNAPEMDVCMTEQLEGVEHLSNNIALNAALPVQRVSSAVLDWSDLDAAKDLLDQRWDLVIGSDLLYAEQAVKDLPALFSRLASASTRILYAHTLHRYDHLDVEFFKAMKAIGLEYREVGDVTPNDEEFLCELFPEERSTVFEIGRAGVSPAMLETRPRTKSDCESDAPRSEPSGLDVAAETWSGDDLGISVVLPDENCEEKILNALKDVPVLRLAVVGPFGNTTHPTTRVILRWLASEEGKHAIRGQQVCDYGCGSGALGIAALLHGAGSCVGVDNDIAALVATTANAEANGCKIAAHLPPAEVLERDIDFYTRFGNWSSRSDGWSPLPLKELRGQCPVVLCNIVVGPLCRSAPTLHELCAPGGWVLLAGFKGSYMKAQVEDAYSDLFGTLEYRGCEDGWGLFVGRKLPVA